MKVPNEARLTEDISVVHAKMELTSQTPADGIKNSGTRQNIFSFVMQRNSETGWLCVSAHNTDVIPGKETIKAIINSALVPLWLLLRIH